MENILEFLFHPFSIFLDNNLIYFVHLYFVRRIWYTLMLININTLTVKFLFSGAWICNMHAMITPIRNVALTMYFYPLTLTHQPFPSLMIAN